MDTYQCPYCSKTLKSERGTTQHIFQTPKCREAQLNFVSATQSQQVDPNCDGAKDPNQEAEGDGLRRSRRNKRRKQDDPDMESIPSRTDTNLHPDMEPNEADSGAADTSSDVDANRSTSYLYEDSSDDEESDATMDPVEEDDDYDLGGPNKEILERFVAYCRDHSDNFLDLTVPEETSIKLMDILRRKKAPLNAFPELLTWHLKEIGHLREHETLNDTDKYFHRKTLMASLVPRYNMSAMVPVLKRVTLPSSKAVVSIPCRLAADIIVHLLTDPRVEDEDYLFFQDDPFAPPPENITYIADLNTGDAYLKSYQQKITKPNQVLLAVPMYIDGCSTGQFSDLPVTALKLSLGIHNRQARDKERSWLELGWVPQVRKESARGKKMFQQSGHLESLDVTVLDGEGDSADEIEEEEDEDGVVKAQDFHTMLSVILESFVELQRTGMLWNLKYKGKLYHSTELVIFVPYVKCDTEEADLLCGKYLTRTINVKHICRYCHCPTNEADDPRAKYPPKSQPAIQKLVENRKLKRLQAISQQYIQNAWYDVAFHGANDRGIHGACPSEMLHAILLGIFKYLRDIFFTYMGKQSQLAEDINGLAKTYGKGFTHQSDRDFPSTNFSKGIQKGKLMAKEYRGVLLIMAAVLRSTLGRKLLFKRKKFGGQTGLSDWTLLVELLLEWEAYLCESKMLRAHVKRLGKKHRFIMCIMRNVAVRTTGMGLKIFKFHAITHLVEDIILYGVPAEVDTGSNESHHKPSKHVRSIQNGLIAFDANLQPNSPFPFHLGVD